MSSAPLDDGMSEESDASGEGENLRPNVRRNDCECNEDREQNESGEFDAEECPRVIIWMRSQSTGNCFRRSVEN